MTTTMTETVKTDYSIQEVAELCDVTTKQVRKWISRGELTVENSGHNLRIIANEQFVNVIEEMLFGD